MKYGQLAVFISHDSAEIWGFGFGLTYAIDILKNMASTGVFGACSLCSQTPYLELSLCIKHDFDLN
jgi:hypothetical protein